MAMSEIANPARERILARIGKALEKKTSLATPPATPLFAPVTDVLQRFDAECKANTTECVITRDRSETCARLRIVLGDIPDGQVFAQDSEEFRGLLRGMERPVIWSTDGPPNEYCEATITHCHALVAVTGSILTSSACGGRGACVVAPVHIVVARESQLVPDLESVLDLIKREDLDRSSSFVGLITGCSRTSDIEKLLVLGAHGPKRLVVILERGS
jgi:L-lactate dehydrogenase complex protein LldG